MMNKIGMSNLWQAHKNKSWFIDKEFFINTKVGIQFTVKDA